MNDRLSLKLEGDNMSFTMFIHPNTHPWRGGSILFYPFAESRARYPIQGHEGKKDLTSDSTNLK